MFLFILWPLSHRIVDTVATLASQPRQPRAPLSTLPLLAPKLQKLVHSHAPAPVDLDPTLPLRALEPQ